jgi:hypothetical protein
MKMIASTNFAVGDSKSIMSSRIKPMSHSAKKTIPIPMSEKRK